MLNLPAIGVYFIWLIISSAWCVVVKLILENLLVVAVLDLLIVLGVVVGLMRFVIK